MTRILLPTLIAIVGILGLITVVPIALRELFPTTRTRELDRWLEDLE